MLLWTFQLGRSLGMADSLSKASWPRAQYSTAIAISRLDYGATGYLIFDQVWQWMIAGGFQADISGAPVDPNAGIAAARGKTLDLPGGRDNPDLYLRDWGDDKGAADYFMAAFLLFGFKIQALYYLYMLVLAISVLVFAVQFFESPGALILAPLYLAAHSLAVVTLPDSMVSSVVHDARFLPALGCLASLHAASVLVQRDRLPRRTLPLLLVQLAVLLLVIDSRPSGIWLIYFPIGAFVLSLLLSWRSRGTSATLSTALWRGSFVVLLLAGPYLLTTYKDRAYDRAYTEDGITAHMVWHSLVMGLSVHPDAQQLGLTYTDATPYKGGFTYLMNHPDLAERLQIDTSTLAFDPQRPGDWVSNGVGFRRYEEIGKLSFLSFVREHPVYAAQAFLWYKPTYLFEQILWQSGLTDNWPAWVKIETVHAPASRHPLDLVSIPAAVAVLLATVAALDGGGARQAGRWIGLTGLLFLASLLPSILVAPIYYEMQVVFLTVSLMLYAVVAAGLAALLPYLRTAIRERHRAPARARLALSLAALAGMGIVGMEFRPPYGTGAASRAIALPGRPPSELARDSLGQVWLLTFEGSRRLFPDWDTFTHYDGDSDLHKVRAIDDPELKKLQWAGLMPSSAARAGVPGNVPNIANSGVQYGSVDLPAGSTNLALMGTATQSDKGGSAAMAIDGKTSGKGDDMSIATLAEPQPAPWWQVDLGQTQAISYIQIWPRTDACCLDRLHNFNVFISDREIASNDPYEARQQPGLTSFNVFGMPTSPTTITIHGTGRYIRIQSAHPGLLDLAEVQVWSDPAAATVPR
jgi:hypothetical protein